MENGDARSESRLRRGKLMLVWGYSTALLFAVAATAYFFLPRGEENMAAGFLAVLLAVVVLSVVTGLLLVGALLIAGVLWAEPVRRTVLNVVILSAGVLGFGACVAYWVFLIRS